MAVEKVLRDQERGEGGPGLVPRAARMEEGFAPSDQLPFQLVDATGGMHPAIERQILARHGRSGKQGGIAPPQGRACA